MRNEFGEEIEKYDVVPEDIWEYIGELLENIGTIAEMIHDEMPLEYQDAWLKAIIEIVVIKAPIANMTLGPV